MCAPCIIATVNIIFTAITHAAVMKRIVEHLVAAHPERPPPVTQYLFIFLKFIQSVIPTVDYDFTVEVEAGT